MRVQLDSGETFDLGTTEATPTIGLTDYSRRVTDDFGVTTVVERGFSRRLSARLLVQSADVDALQQRLALLRGTPARWMADDSLAWLTVRGFYKDFSIDMPSGTASFCTLTVEGVAETETGADPGGDPAPIGQASTLLLLQPADVTDAVLAGSSVGEVYAEWSAATTYPAGARVVRASTHRIYESAAPGNIGSDPAALSGAWADVGPMNRWAMFDQALGSATTAPGSIIVALDVTDADAVALLDVVGATVRVQAAGYDRTDPVGAGAVTFLDLPATTGRVTVTIAGSGTVSAGTLLVGRLVPLGITETSPTAGITDYSRKVTDDFGTVTVVPRSWAKRMTTSALIRTDAIDTVANRIAAVRARPSLWIGDADRDALTVYGFFKDFSIERGESVSKVALSIEGLSKAAPIAKPAVVLVPRGEFDPAVSYGAGDVVQYEGSSWLYVGANATTGQAPPHLPAEQNAFWRVFARAGTIGQDGRGGYTAVLSNENHILPADPDGTVLTYDGASTTFQIYYGATDVSDQFNLSVAADPENLTETINGRTVTVTGGLDAQEPSAQLTIRATGAGDHTGVIIDKEFKLAKSRAGADAPLIQLASSVPVVRYDRDDRIASGPITITAARVNSPAAPIFLIYGFTGDAHVNNTAAAIVAAYPGIFSSTGPDNLTMTEAWVNDVVAGFGGGIRFIVKHGDTGIEADRIGLPKVRDGLTGASSFTLIGGTDLAITPTSATKVSGGPWTAESVFYTLEPRTGGCEVSFYVGATTGPLFSLGLTTPDLASPDGVHSLWEWHVVPNGNASDLQIFAGTTIRGTHGQTAGQIATIRYDNEEILWLLDGAIVDRHTVGAGLTFRVRGNIGSVGAGPSRVAWSAAGARGTNGQSALVAQLTNESHNVPCAPNGDPISYVGASGQMRVYYGLTEVTNQCVFAEIDNQNASVDPSFNGASNGYYQLDILAADVGTVTLRATYSGTSIDKIFTLTKTRQGADGSSPPDISLSASSLVLRRNADGSLIPGQPDFVFTATRTNLAQANAFSFVPGHPVATAGVSVSGDTLTVTAQRMWEMISYNEGEPSLGYASVKVVASAGALADTATVVGLREGASAYSLILTNENAPVPADKDGNVTSYAATATSMLVLYGATDVTALFTASLPSNPQGLSVTGSYPDYIVSDGFDAGEDTATITFRATGTGAHAGVVLNKTMTLGKVRAGADGTPAKTLSVFASAPAIRYNKNDQIVSGAITFTTVRGGNPGVPRFQLFGLNGAGFSVAATAADLAAAEPSIWSTTGPDNLTLTQAWLNAVVTGPYGGGLRVNVSGDDGIVADSVALAKIKDGADGQDALFAQLTNATFNVPTAYDGSYAVFPQAASAGNMRVFLGGVEVTSQCTFTYQNPANLDARINADGSYYALGLYGDTGLSYLIATYQGRSIALTYTASKSRGGADGSPAVDISVAATPQQVRYNKLDQIVTGDVVVTTVRKNTAGEPGFLLRSADGTIHGFAGMTAAQARDNYGAATFDTGGPDNLVLKQAWVNAVMQGYGGSLTIIASAGGVTDETSIGKTKDGADGKDSTVPGPPGKDSTVPGPPGASADDLGLGVKSSGMRNVVVASNGSNTVTLVNDTITLLAGRKLRLTLGADSPARSTGGSFCITDVVATLSYGGSALTLFQGRVSITPEVELLATALTAASAMLVDNPASGDATLTITHTRSGPSGNGGSFRLAYSLERL